MERIEKCIYCGASFDPTKGQGDHILPVQLGEFRNDVRFRRICRPCNNRIGRSEQQFLRCGPESFLRSIVKPEVPRKRQRGRSQAKAAMGAPGPESTIDHGDHHELVVRSNDNPKDIFPVDQIVIHDAQGQEYFIRVFPGMRPEQLKICIEKRNIGKVDKTWFHCDEDRKPEIQRLLRASWPQSEMQELAPTEAGVTQVSGRIMFRVTDHYFRSLAKIGFHYYLAHSQRGFRGDEDCFAAIRDFIANGGDRKEFFDKPRMTFAPPFGRLRSGGVITPEKWGHWLAADETEKMAVVYLHLFVGRGCVPRPHYITLAHIDSRIHVPRATWAHVYLYNDPPVGDGFAGYVEEARVSRA